MDYNTAVRTRQQVAACALRQRQWECNGGLYDIIIHSISVSPTEERHIETTYGSAANPDRINSGLAGLSWIS
eukprot:560708-Prymnesium_polylepis.1